MDILGVGFPELLFIFIIALMVFGPRRLPEIAGKAGKFVRDLRNMSQGFMTEWQREITVAARLDELQEVQRELKETKESLTQTRAEITSSANQIGQVVSSVVKPALPSVTAPPSLSSSPPPPVADTSKVDPPAEVVEVKPAPAPVEVERNGSSPTPPASPSEAAE